MNYGEQILPSRQGERSQEICRDFIDAVACINLDKRVDRWESCCRVVSNIVPQEKIHRISAVLGAELTGCGKPPWFTERTGERSSYWAAVAGCTLSHRKAIETALKSGWRNVLILEDDVVANMVPDSWEMLREALECIRGRYLLYLGYTNHPRGIRVVRNAGATLWQINGALAAHAYIVPESMYCLLLDALPKGEEDVWEWLAKHRAVDTFYMDEVPTWSGVNIYAIWPLIFRQNGMSSDLVAVQVVSAAPVECEPQEIEGICGWLYRLMEPVRRLKTYLNSIRTHRRALRGGFPGFRKKRHPKA